jgi:hypothetical protein
MGFVLEEDAERLEQELAQACLERDSARNVLARAIEHERLANMRATEWEEARDAAQEVANRETLLAAYWKDKASAVSATPAINLENDFWDQIVQAALDSPWMPDGYMMNDWVADICAFLRRQDISLLIEAVRDFQAVRQELPWNCSAMTTAANDLAAALARYESARADNRSADEGQG